MPGREGESTSPTPWTDIADCVWPRFPSAIVHSSLDGPGRILRATPVRDVHPRSFTQHLMVLVGYCGRLWSAMHVHNPSS
ncbi:hypothetical protein F2Q69_00015993 [Brassica cretica]|uniref:Uncharacterized protein n=1 Tax=Brassica cretica TaxID=69181 RepID=A0A8S9QV61_BRACR|nr:hypothetical protein F2Q69_00015993 [Brassica cretica]